MSSFKDFLRKKGITPAAFARKPEEVKAALEKEFARISNGNGKPDYAGYETERDRVRAKARAAKMAVRGNAFADADIDGFDEVDI